MATFNNKAHRYVRTQEMFLIETQFLNSFQLDLNYDLVYFNLKG